MAAPLEGGCLCGAVRYRVAALAGPVLLCHCGQCRKAQGSAFAANAPVRIASQKRALNLDDRIAATL